MSVIPVTSSNAPDAGARRLRGSRQAWLVTGLLFGFMLVNFADKAVLGLAAKPMSAAFGLDAASYGHVASAFYLLFSVCAIGVGTLANRVPTRWLLVALALTWSVAQLPMLWTSSVGLLVASRVLLGAAEGPAFGLANHALQKWFVDEKRQIPSSVVALGASVGTIVAAPVLAWVIVHAGWRQGYLVLVLAGVVWIGLWLAFVRQEGPYGATSSASAVAGTAVEEARAGYRRILTCGTFVGSTLLGFAAYFGLALSVTWLPRFLQEGRGFSLTAAGTAVAVFWAVGGVLTLGAGIVSQQLTVRGVSTTWSRGMLSVAMVGVGGLLTVAGVLVDDPGVSLVLLVVGLTAPGSVFALGQTLAGQISPVRQRGTVLGVGVAISTLAGMVAPTVMGHLVQSAPTALDGYNRGYLVLGLACVGAALVGAVLIRPARDAARLRRPVGA